MACPPRPTRLSEYIAIAEKATNPGTATARRIAPSAPRIAARAKSLMPEVSSASAGLRSLAPVPPLNSVSTGFTFLLGPTYRSPRPWMQTLRYDRLMKRAGNPQPTEYPQASANASPSAWSNPSGRQLAAGMLCYSHPRGLPRQWQAGALAATLRTRLRSQAAAAECIACPNPPNGLLLVVF